MKIFFPDCRLEQPAQHRFCVRCGSHLPTELLDVTPVKTTRFFAGIKATPGDPEQAYLRVSCYLKEQSFETEEGSVTIPGHHVRFSVWTDDQAQCVISIPETEAADLVTFITSQLALLKTTALHTIP